jgi:hypothetical protein
VWYLLHLVEGVRSNLAAVEGVHLHFEVLEHGHLEHNVADRAVGLIIKTCRYGCVFRNGVLRIGIIGYFRSGKKDL